MKYDIQPDCPAVHFAAGGVLHDVSVSVSLWKWHVQMCGRAWWASDEYSLFLLLLCHPVESSLCVFVCSKHSFNSLNALQEKFPYKVLWFCCLVMWVRPRESDRLISCSSFIQLHKLSAQAKKPGLGQWGNSGNHRVYGMPCWQLVSYLGGRELVPILTIHSASHHSLHCTSLRIDFTLDSEINCESLHMKHVWWQATHRGEDIRSVAFTP